MFKYLVTFLLVLNLALWGWVNGWFLASQHPQGRSPMLLQQQYKPDAIKIVTNTNNSTDEYTREWAQNSSTSALPETTNTQETFSAESLPPTNSLTNLSCVEIAPLDENQIASLQLILKQVLPDNIQEIGDYKEVRSWAVYIGPYNDQEQAEEQLKALRHRNIDVSLIRGKPEYEPGVTLGLYQAYQNAKNHLDKIHSQGIEEAKIVPWTTISKGQQLRISNLTQDQVSELNAYLQSVSLPESQLCN